MLRVLMRAISFLWKEYHFLVPPIFWKEYAKLIVKRVKERGNVYYNPLNAEEYRQWLNEKVQETKLEKLAYEPSVTILCELNVDSLEVVQRTVDSVCAQTYRKIELLVFGEENLLESEYFNELKKTELKMVLFKTELLQQKEEILKIARGEYFIMMTCEEVLVEDAVYEMVKAVGKERSIQLVYGDNDSIDKDGKYCCPHFKPDFSPDTLLSLNYIGSCPMIKAEMLLDDELILGVGQVDSYDMYLRVAEVTDKIHHVSRILYHTQKEEVSSLTQTIILKQKEVLEYALKRRNAQGKVTVDSDTGYFKVKYQYETEPKVSILIPTRDHPEVLRICVDSIYAKTEYSNFEIIVLDNQSQELETKELFHEYETQHDNFKTLLIDTEFNYSYINNMGVAHSEGDFVVLLNNDTEVLTPTWLSEMVGYAMQPHIGTVGAKLYFPDMTIQHAGVAIGIGGMAAHLYYETDAKECGEWGALKVPYNYSIMTAACLMIEKKKFYEVKGLEEQLKVAYNDVEFNLKVLEAGYYNVLLPQVELMHYESKSRGLDTTREKLERFKNEERFMEQKWNLKEAHDRFYNANYSRTRAFWLDGCNNKYV